MPTNCVLFASDSRPACHAQYHHTGGSVRVHPARIPACKQAVQLASKFVQQTLAAAAELYRWSPYDRSPGALKLLVLCDHPEVI